MATGDADAAKMAKSKLVLIKGCAQHSTPFCETISWHGKTYVLNSADPRVPVKTGVTVIGEISGDISLCDAIPVTVVKWQNNHKMLCPQ
jgi:hypothetical protein